MFVYGWFENTHETITEGKKKERRKKRSVLKLASQQDLDCTINLSSDLQDLILSPTIMTFWLREKKKYSVRSVHEAWYILTENR